MLRTNTLQVRIGFNFYQLTAGVYTFVVEFFPPTFTNVSVDCRRTSIDVNHQTMKNFPEYCKNIVQLHKWKISPPEYLMVDIKCERTASFPADGIGWMIVYGVEGTHNDVSSTVFDAPFTIKRGNVVFETTVKLNYNRLEYLSYPNGITEATRKS